MTSNNIMASQRELCNRCQEYKNIEKEKAFCVGAGACLGGVGVGLLANPGAHIVSVAFGGVSVILFAAAFYNDCKGEKIAKEAIKINDSLPEGAGVGKRCVGCKVGNLSWVNHCRPA